VHQALITDSRFDDARWLVGKMFDTRINNAEFIKSETAATDKMVANLTSDAENYNGDDSQISAAGKKSIVAAS